MSITLPKRSETQPTRLLTIAAGLLFLMSGLVLVHQVWFVDRAPANVLWTATVERGSFVHTVRAAGFLEVGDAPERLEAVLDVNVSQAADVREGQPVDIDTRQGILSGSVSTIGPTVRPGVVRVDIRLDLAEPPANARPGLAIDGTIEIEHIEDTLFVSRPAQVRPFSTTSLVRIAEDGTEIRKNVRIGRLSVQYAQILDGLEVGDEVVISDLSQQEEICIFPLP